MKVGNKKANLKKEKGVNPGKEKMLCTTIRSVDFWLFKVQLKSLKRYPKK